jgi:hypothetical protein
MKIKILQRMQLDNNLRFYKEVEDATLINYTPCELEVTDEYYERFKALPEYIEILEAPKYAKEEVVVEEPVKKATKSKTKEVAVETEETK